MGEEKWLLWLFSLAVSAMLSYFVFKGNCYLKPIGHMESINQPILHIMITTIVCVNRCVCGLIGRALRNAKRAQGQKQTKAASTESSSTTTTAATAAGAGGSSLISPSSDDMPPHEPHSPALHKSRYQQLVTTQMSTSCVCVT
jgi:hypothetical protein